MADLSCHILSSLACLLCGLLAHHSMFRYQFARLGQGSGAAALGAIECSLTLSSNLWTSLFDEQLSRP